MAIILIVDELALLWADYALKGRCRNALQRAGLTPYQVAHMEDAHLLEIRSLGEATVAMIRVAIPYAGIDHATALWRHIQRHPRPSEQRAIEHFRKRLAGVIRKAVKE